MTLTNYSLQKTYIIFVHSVRQAQIDEQKLSQRTVRFEARTTKITHQRKCAVPSACILQGSALFFLVRIVGELVRFHLIFCSSLQTCPMFLMVKHSWWTTSCISVSVDVEAVDTHLCAGGAMERHLQKAEDGWPIHYIGPTWFSSFQSGFLSRFFGGTKKKSARYSP